MSPASPLSGTLTVDLPRLKAVGDLLGPDVALDGRLAANLTFAGTVGAPKVSGLLDGQGIDVALYDQGIRLTDGTVHVGLDQNVVDLKEVVFHGGDGTLRARAACSWARPIPTWPAPWWPTGCSCSPTRTAR